MPDLAISSIRYGMQEENELAICEQHIADLERRLADLENSPGKGSGFMTPFEFADLLQSTLDSWKAQKARLAPLQHD